MKLWEQQSLFAFNVSKLIQFINTSGDLTISGTGVNAAGNINIPSNS